MTQLVEYNDNIDGRLKITTSDAFEALFQAIEEENYKMFEWYLFPPGEFWCVDPNIVNQYGNFILSVAILNRNIQAVKLLLKFGANPNAKDRRGHSILDLAFASDVGIEEIHELCFKGLSDNELKKHGVHLLYMAVHHSDVVLLRELIRLDVNVCSKFGAIHSPLILAVENERLDIFMLLLNAGADLNVKDKNENSLLHLAIGKRDVIEALNDLQVDIHAKNILGNTALHVAACGNCVMSIQELLEHGAKIETENNEKLTPIKLALKFESEKSAHCLFKLLKNLEKKN